MVVCFVGCSGLDTQSGGGKLLHSTNPAGGGGIRENESFRSKPIPANSTEIVKSNVLIT
jgi:hypothetical protein